jgi:hypothetical protein
MNAISWLTRHRFESLIRRGYDWVFAFDSDAHLVVACLWRLLENGRIRYTSLDEGQKFGLLAPVNAAEEINSRVAGAHVQSADLREGTLDISLRLSTGYVIEIIPDSSGYEAWQLRRKDAQFIAVGGGDLTIFGTVRDEE